MAFKKRQLKYGLVAFIDLLGFSDRVQSMITSADLEAVDKDVTRVQKWFDHNPADQIIKEVQTITSKSVLAFSDCIGICVPLVSELTKTQGDFDVLMSEITNLGMGQGRCVVNDIFLRGGSSLGLWYRNKDTLISPAMVEAYHLERDACVPMIAISNSLYNHLSNHKHRNYYASDLDPVAKIFRRYEDLPNQSARWFIDYIPICLEAVDGLLSPDDRSAYKAGSPEERHRIRNAAWWRDCDRWAIWHRDAIRKAFAAAQSNSVRAKYVWLAAYHDEAVSRFYGRSPTELLIGNLAAC